MEYSIREVAKMTGVSTRTLRYYDAIGLLKPLYTNDSGYRYYGEEELDRLQQILFYKERGLGLQCILEILDKEEFDTLGALYEHLFELQNQKIRIEKLILTVNKTIDSLEGRGKMSSAEKFEAFKQQQVQQNEEKYGTEIREKYGEDSVRESNAKMMKMTEEEYKKFQNAETLIKEKLQEAVRSHADPSGEIGEEITELHKNWISMTWGQYRPEAHRGLAEMYVQDERFLEYYDEEVSGCAEFLKAAVLYWAK